MTGDPTGSARALASRRNGARSLGPRTATGKSRSARNALKHGLCAHSDEAGRLIRRKAGSRSDRKRALDRTKAAR